MNTPSRSSSEMSYIKRKWLEKSGTFVAILVFNLCILLLLAGQVIYKVLVQREDEPMTFAKIAKPTPVPIQHAKGGEASKSLVDPSEVVVPPTMSVPSVVVSPNSQMNFKMEVSTLPSTSLALPSFEDPSGTGLGKGGTSGGPTAEANPFGEDPTSGATGLLGELYDLKQTPDGTPTPMAIVPPEDVNVFSPIWAKLPATIEGIKVLQNYVKHWSQDILDQYYKSPKELETAQLFIPLRPSILATKAFGVADKVSARRWVIHYHGTVKPQTGRFRFMGYGDDFLVVRLDNRNVLDGSIRGGGEVLDRAANGPVQQMVPGPNGHQLYCGQWFNTDSTVPVPIEILIGEGPGGVSGFTLLIQEEGDTSTPGDYPVFQVAPQPLPKLPTVTSAFSGKTLIFPAQ